MRQLSIYLEIQKQKMTGILIHNSWNLTNYSALTKLTYYSDLHMLMYNNVEVNIDSTKQQIKLN